MPHIITGTGPTQLRSFLFPDADATLLAVTSAMTAGDLLYGSGAASVGKVAAVAVGSVLVSSGVGVAPAWSASPTLSVVTLAAVSTAVLGNIFKGIDRFLHNFAAPGSDGLNTFLGTQAGNFTLGPGGGASNLASTNTGIGHLSLNALTTGRDNTGVGKGTLYRNTTGEFNTAVGTDALVQNTTGHFNTAIGVDALFSNVSGSENVAIGENALVFADSPSGNTAVGFSALYALTSGAGNVAVGRSAGGSLTTSGNNVCVGYAAGNLQAVGTVLTLAANSVYIGRDTRGLDNTDTNTIVLGYAAIGMGANTAVIGNVNLTDVYFGSGTAAARLRATGLNLGTTPATAGTIRLASAFTIQARNAANTANREVLATDALDVTRLQGAQNTIADAGIVSVGTAGASMGFLVVSNRTQGAAALYRLEGGNTPTLVSGSASLFTVTATTASRTNVYWSSGNSRYELENKMGSGQAYVLTYLGG